LRSAISAGLPEAIGCTERRQRRATNALLTFTRLGPSISDSLDIYRPGRLHSPPAWRTLEHTAPNFTTPQTATNAKYTAPGIESNRHHLQQAGATPQGYGGARAQGNDTSHELQQRLVVHSYDGTVGGNPPWKCGSPADSLVCWS
jgi:hypothetical protein